MEVTRIAIATADGVSVCDHLARAAAFVVVEVSGGVAGGRGTRGRRGGGGGEQRASPGKLGGGEGGASGWGVRESRDLRGNAGGVRCGDLWRHRARRGGHAGGAWDSRAGVAGGRRDSDRRRLAGMD